MKRKALTEEEFAAWRNEAVTQLALKALGNAADMQRDAWLAASWEGAECDPLLLRELKTRADAYRSLAEITHADLMEWNG